MSYRHAPFQALLADIHEVCLCDLVGQCLHTDLSSAWRNLTSVPLLTGGAGDYIPRIVRAEGGEGQAV